MAIQEIPSRAAETLALELVDRRSLRDGAPRDVLRTPADLVAWIEDRGLAPPGPILDAISSPAGTRILLDEARHLRLDVERLFVAFSARRELPAAALFGLNRVLEASCTSLRLEVGTGTPRLVEQGAVRDLLSVLTPVAASAARILAEVDPARLRKCESPECGIWFVDTSKAGRRRWCSMSRCGNRAKAARHRRRARTG